MQVEARPRRFRRAIVASIVLHALLLALLFRFAASWTPPPAPEPPPVAVVLVPPEAAPFPGLAPPSRWVHVHPSAGAAPAASPSAKTAPSTPGSDSAASGPAVTVGGDAEPGALRDRIEQHFHDELFAPPADGAGVRARHDGAYGSETDSIDGVAHLGSGEPGDPRIPGSGGVDIGKAIARDAIVLQARERADRGQIPKFLADAKDRIETCWLPTAADANVVSSGWSVPDRGCAVGFHFRHRVGRVFVVYDAGGNRLSMDVADVTVARDLLQRVADAITRAGMTPPPKELLSPDGTLRVAWNVYIDDFRHCGLVGRGANADKPGGDKIIGIVELDGVY